jgi:flagella basal body P-ring formation protein FlgA
LLCPRGFYNLPYDESQAAVMKRFSFSIALALAALGALPFATQAQESGVENNFQDPLAVRQVAEDYLRDRLASLPGNPSIKMDDPRTEHLPACDDLTASMPGGTRPRSRMSVGVRCSAPRPWSVYVQATISMPGQYYVTTRPLNPGEVITADVLAPRDGDLLNLPPGAVTDAQTVIGMSASYRIPSGQPIKQASLRSPGTVQRGQTVRVNAHGQGFSVSTEGQALANAAPGSMVQVRTSSGQIISGIVQSSGSVEVPL